MLVSAAATTRRAKRASKEPDAELARGLGQPSTVSLSSRHQHHYSHQRVPVTAYCSRGGSRLFFIGGLALLLRSRSPLNIAMGYGGAL